MNIEKAYDLWHKLHKENIYMEEPEYYKLLGALIEGKKSVDVGCGYGALEMFSPNTVGVDFSDEALKKAEALGVKNLVKSKAEELPFEDNEFEVAVSIGTLEHVEDIEKSIKEMVRVSEIQILVVHAALPFPLNIIRKPMMKVFGLKDQPIENPQTIRNIKRILKENNSRVIIEGVWNYVDLRWIWKKLPYGFLKIPSHIVTFSIKTESQERKFLGDKIN